MLRHWCVVLSEPAAQAFPPAVAEFEQDYAAVLGPFFRGGELSWEIEVMFFTGRK